MGIVAVEQDMAILHKRMSGSSSDTAQANLRKMLQLLKEHQQRLIKQRFAH